MPLTRRSLIAAASAAAATQGDAHAAPAASGQSPGAEGSSDAAPAKIALEEHFITPTMLDYFKTGRPALGAQVLNTLIRRLSDFGEERLAEMGRAGVAKSILSVSGPGVQIEPDTMTAQKRAKQVNDVLAAQIAKRPDRYGGFAHLAMQDPKTAADELERCVHDLGFVGALINGQTNGVYLDDSSNDVFWERMQALNVPLYLHPADSFELPYVLEGAPELRRATWEWTTETSSHALRLIVAGVLDRYPHLRIILGHAGETLPYMLWRLDSRYAFYTTDRRIKQAPSAYLKQNFWITMSGQFSAVPLQAAIAALGQDRVMFSIDYPFESSEVAGKFMDTTPLSDDLRKRVASGNATALLHLSA